MRQGRLPDDVADRVDAGLTGAAVLVDDDEADHALFHAEDFEDPAPVVLLAFSDLEVYVAAQ